MLKSKDFLFKIKIVSYSLVNYFLVLGIGLQTGYVFLCFWNISLLLLSYFCYWELQLFRCLQCYRFVCANQLYVTWSFLWGNHKKGWTKFLKLSGGKQKGKNMIFDSNLVGRKTLEVTMINFYISRYHFS